MDQVRSAQLYQDFICETDGSDRSGRSGRSGRSVGIKILLYCDSGPELNKLFIFQRAGADLTWSIVRR